MRTGDLLTLGDVAERLGLSVDTVRRMCDTGMIEYLAVKTSPKSVYVKRRVRASVLERYIAANTVPAQDQDGGV